MIVGGYASIVKTLNYQTLPEGGSFHPADTEARGMAPGEAVLPARDTSSDAANIKRVQTKVPTCRGSLFALTDRTAKIQSESAQRTPIMPSESRRDGTVIE